MGKPFYDMPDEVADTVFDPTDETFGPIMAAIQKGDFEAAAEALTQIAPSGKTREVLVHLNVTIPPGDVRRADVIADSILSAISVGSDHPSVRDLEVVCPLAEEI